jgi:hypothetical protein
VLLAKPKIVEQANTTALEKYGATSLAAERSLRVSLKTLIIEPAIND